MPASALLVIRLLVTVVAVLAAWRFGAEGVLLVAVFLAALLIAIKGRRVRRDLD